MVQADKGKEHVRGWNVNLYPSTWEALRVRAFEERTTISEQVRRAVATYLSKREGVGKLLGKRKGQ